MKDVLVMIPLWQRPKIFKIVASRLQAQRVVCIISPEDPCFYQLASICQNHDFHMISAPNFPVGRKMNLAIDKIVRMFEFKYLMGLNSDNILDRNYWDIIKPYIREGHPMIGMSQIVAYDMESRRGIKLTLAEDDVCKVWGGGRLLSYDAIVRTKITMGKVYQDDLNSGLDTSSQRMIFENVLFPKPPAIIHGCHLIDLKTPTNINPYNTLGNVPHERVTQEYIENKFGKIPNNGTYY